MRVVAEALALAAEAHSASANAVIVRARARRGRRCFTWGLSLWFQVPARLTRVPDAFDQAVSAACRGGPTFG